MYGTSQKSANEGRQIDRNDLRDTEVFFGSIMADVARMLWPRNTAPEIASRLDCSVRNVELQLGGHQKWSGDAIALLVSEILKRHSMRNVRVTARR